jgi:hypothetical protein
MKLYRIITVSLLNVFNIVSTKDYIKTKYEYSEYSKEIEFSSLDSLELGIINYGNWCGPSHGGYQDCCNGKPCESCKLNEGILYVPSPECLNSCNPIDELDYYCAIHDKCCLLNHNLSNIECSPEGNKCECDCLLVKQVSNFECSNYSCKYYSKSLLYLFNNLLSCWYIDENTNTEYCNKNNLNLTNYCNDIIINDIIINDIDNKIILY